MTIAGFKTVDWHQYYAEHISPHNKEQIGVQVGFIGEMRTMLRLA